MGSSHSEWFVNLVYGYCYYATKLNYSASRAVVDLKSKNDLDEEDGQ